MRKSVVYNFLLLILLLFLKFCCLLFCFCFCLLRWFWMVCLFFLLWNMIGYFLIFFFHLILKKEGAGRKKGESKLITFGFGWKKILLSALIIFFLNLIRKYKNNPGWCYRNILLFFQSQLYRFVFLNENFSVFFFLHGVFTTFYLMNSLLTKSSSQDWM